MAYTDAEFQIGMKLVKNGEYDPNEFVTDTVTRLRARGDDLSLEAAEEIQRLRTQIDTLTLPVKQVRKRR